MDAGADGANGGDRVGRERTRVEIRGDPVQGPPGKRVADFKVGRTKGGTRSKVPGKGMADFKIG